MTDKTTHFGFQTIETEQKAPRVREVFDTVAARYDVMNDLMSGGMHRLWKQSMVDTACRFMPMAWQVLDLAGGTGDITFRLQQRAGKMPQGSVN